MHGPLRVMVAACVLLGSACASLPQVPQPDTADTAAAEENSTGDVSGALEARGADIARLARAQLGAPYRYGGSDPDGFDCSGLVQYIYRQDGLTLPRTVLAQLQAAQPIPLAALLPGDLLFFSSNGDVADHVGIYVGADLMVHAPRTGRAVELRRIDDSWYALHIRATGRLLP